MATVRLKSYDGRVENLPQLCMRCGAPASVIRRRSFSWHPQWVIALLLAGLLPYVIVALVLTKKARVEVPLCEKHKNHWLWRLLFLIGWPAVLVAIGLPVWIVLMNLSNGAMKDAAGFVCVACAALMLVWLIAAAILESVSIRPAEITDRTIKLSGVAEEFADAYENELAESESELDERVHERWRDRNRRRSKSIRRPRDEDDDPPDTYRARED